MSDTAAVNPDGVQRQRRAGLVLAPILAILVYLLCGTGLTPEARCAASIGTLMVVLWITEAIPLPATSLLPIVFFPLLGIVSVEQATAPFSKPVIFLFLGGFCIALAVEQSGLHRRIALMVVRTFGGTACRLLAGFMVATGFLSMWISNTAATVMMIPIAASLVGLLPWEDVGLQKAAQRFELCLLLGIAYSANIGGLGTLVGTPPNALLAGFLHEQDITIGFGQWMLLAIPIVVLLLLLSWLVLSHVMLDKDARSLSVSYRLIEVEYRKLGRTSRPEWTVVVVFAVTVALWITREPLSHWQWFVDMFPSITRISDASIAIAAAVTLFLLPQSKSSSGRILEWQAASRIPWGVLLLIGGGMSLASGLSESGLNAALAAKLESLLALHPALLVIAVTGLVIFLTEVASNTAIAAAVLPVLFGLGANAECGPLLLVVPATLAASCAFMLPIATAPNAVVFGTGRVPMHSMLRYGLWLNALGMIIIPLMMYLLGWLLVG